MRGNVAIKLKTTGEYHRAIEALRPYADGFTAADGYDLRKLKNPYDNPLTRSQQAKVAKYFDVLQRHAGYKGTSYQYFRDPKKLRGAQIAMGMPSRSLWRGVFVPQPSDGTPAKLVQRGGKWLIEYRYQGVDTIFVPFDKMLFAEHGTSYVRGLFYHSPKSYLYNLDMGYGRNRWKAGGNLEQMLRDLEFIINSYGHYSDFVMGVHVYRGGLDAYNELKIEHFSTVKHKKISQEKIKKIIRKERRELTDWEEYLRLVRKFGK